MPLSLLLVAAWNRYQVQQWCNTVCQLFTNITESSTQILCYIYIKSPPPPITTRQDQPLPLWRRRADINRPLMLNSRWAIPDFPPRPPRHFLSLRLLGNDCHTLWLSSSDNCLRDRRSLRTWGLPARLNYWGCCY